MNALALVNKVIVEKLRLSDTVNTLANASATVLEVLWAINEVKRRMLDMYDLTQFKDEGTINLATDTTLYSLASDFLRFTKPKRIGPDLWAYPVYYTKVQDGSSAVNNFTVVNDQEFRNHTALNVTEGLPYIGRLFGYDSSGNHQLEVYGNVTAAYNGTSLYYEYIKDIADISANDDILPLPDHLLINGAYLTIRVSNGDADEHDLVSYLSTEGSVMLNNESGRVRRLQYTDM